MASELKIPIDIPDVAVMSSQVTHDGKLLIRVESEVATTECGICHQTIRCNAGHRQELRRMWYCARNERKVRTAGRKRKRGRVWCGMSSAVRLPKRMMSIS
jgi:hypothetical protein